MAFVLALSLALAGGARRPPKPPGVRFAALAAYNIIGPEHINWAIANTQKKGVCRKACVRAALALIHKLNPERAELFEKRISEQDLPADTPENKLHFAMTDRGKLSQDGENMLAMRGRRDRSQRRRPALVRGWRQDDYLADEGGEAGAALHHSARRILTHQAPHRISV